MKNDNNVERDFAQGRAVGHAITIGRMKPQLREAVRLLRAVYGEFIDHTFIVAGPTPTDGSKDTQWMKDTERFLNGVSEFAETQVDEIDELQHEKTIENYYAEAQQDALQSP